MLSKVPRPGSGAWRIASTVALIAVLLVAVSSLFAQSDQTGRAIAAARTAQRAEEVMTALTATRASVTVALLAASVESASDDRLVDTARSDLDALIAELDRRIGLLGGSSADRTRLEEKARGFDLLLAGGDLVGARQSATDQLLPTLDAIEATTSNHLNAALTDLAVEEGSAGRMVRATSVVVGLIVPGLMFFSFRSLQRRRQRQRELEIRVEHAQERSRIKDQMIANLSHELRTPLTAIYGMALTLGEEGFAEPELGREMTDIIVGEAADLSRMVDDLLAAAKVEAGDIAMMPEAVDPARIVEEVLVPFRRSHNIACRIEPAWIVADPLRLRQVMRNLVSNAIKHGGGHVGVIGTAKGDRFRIAVVDDGPGVAPDLEERLFERFIHDGAAPLTEGSVGLGLAIARELAARMRGELSYTRTANITTFTLDLPLARAERPEAVAAT